MNKSGESRHPCPVPDLTIKYNINYQVLVAALNQTGEIPLYFYFSDSFFFLS